MSNGLNYTIQEAMKAAKLPISIEWIEADDMWKVKWKWPYMHKSDIMELDDVDAKHVFIFKNMEVAKKFYLSIRTQMMEISGV